MPRTASTMSNAEDDKPSDEEAHQSNIVKQARAVKLAQRQARNLRADQDLINAGHGQFKEYSSLHYTHR